MRYIAGANHETKGLGLDSCFQQIVKFSSFRPPPALRLGAEL
jgi:hypothetical protein